MKILQKESYMDITDDFPIITLNYPSAPEKKNTSFCAVTACDWHMFTRAN